MENALADLPLALFTTLAPIGAGAYLALAVLFVVAKLSEAQLRKLDRLSFVPFIVVTAGFMGAFFHLQKPESALGVFNGVGPSPLSNEILAGVIFLGIALIYCIFATLGKLNVRARKACAVIVALAALVFVIFIGLAYMINTIPSWNTLLTPLALLGFALVGGSLLNTVILIKAGIFHDVKQGIYKQIALTKAISGGVFALVGVIGQIVFVSGLISPGIAGSDLIEPVIMPAVIAVCGILAALCCFVILFSTSNDKDYLRLSVIGLVATALAIFLARLVFYALEMTVGF